MDFSSASSKNLTKITTLRLAVNYIAALTEILKEPDPSGASSSIHRPQTSSSSFTQPIACSSRQDDPLGATSNTDTDSSLGSLGITSLDLGLDLSPSDFPLSESDELTASDLDNCFLIRQCISGAPSSCGSSDLPSHNSPLSTDSIESFASGCGAWDFTSADDGLADVAETFDLILESEGENVS